MKKLIVLMSWMFCATFALAQNMYVKTFGNPKAQPLLFLHGGPGGSSIDFELTTAEKLAARGFFVIVYDRRGEGRSDDSEAKFTFGQTLDDLNEIYTSNGLKKAALLGHSFGGVVGTRFAAQYPDKVSHLILVGAPVSMQQTFRTILNTVEGKAEAKGDSATLAQINFVKKQDTASVFYSSGSFMLAMQNGIYTAANPGPEATGRMEAFTQHPATKAYMENLAKTNYRNMYLPTMGYINNEKYTTIDLTADLRQLQGPALYGIYGKEDGLFDTAQIALIRDLINEPTAFLHLDNCSHGVFMDRQDAFINALVTWLK